MNSHLGPIQPWDLTASLLPVKYPGWGGALSHKWTIFGKHRAHNLEKSEWLISAFISVLKKRKKEKRNRQVSPEKTKTHLINILPVISKFWQKRHLNPQISMGGRQQWEAFCPANPPCLGADFVGWYSNSTCGSQGSFTESPEGRAWMAGLRQGSDELHVSMCFPGRHPRIWEWTQ